MCKGFSHVKLLTDHKNYVNQIEFMPGTYVVRLSSMFTQFSELKWKKIIKGIF